MPAVGAGCASVGSRYVGARAAARFDGGVVFNRVQPRCDLNTNRPPTVSLSHLLQSRRRIYVYARSANNTPDTFWGGGCVGGGAGRGRRSSRRRDDDAVLTHVPPPPLTPAYSYVCHENRRRARARTAQPIFGEVLTDVVSVVPRVTFVLRGFFFSRVAVYLFYHSSAAAII